MKLDLDALELDMRGNAEISLPRDELAALVAIARAAVAWRNGYRDEDGLSSEKLHTNLLDALREAGL